MRTMRRLCVVEIIVEEEQEDIAVVEWEDRLDAFREAVRASAEYGVTIYLAQEYDLRELLTIAPRADIE